MRTYNVRTAVLKFRQLTVSWRRYKTPFTLMTNSPRLRYAIPICVGLVIFASHYSRDVFGTLQVEVEKYLQIDSVRFQTLNSVYFFPNIIMPYLASILSQKWTIRTVYLGFVSIALFGHILVAIGIHFKIYYIILVGRIALGASYEIIDVFPVGMIAPHFLKEFALMMGINNSFVRFGSVSSFLWSPMFYRKSGVKLAVSIASAMGSITWIFAVILWLTDRHLERLRHCTEELRISSIEVETDPTTNQRQPLLDKDEELQEKVSENQTERSSGHFGKTFWLYIVSGTFFYGNIMPWLFYGSAYLQKKYHLQLEFADRLIFIPEVTLAILGPIVGYIISRYEFTTKKLLLLTTSSLILFPIGYTSIGFLPIHYAFGIGALSLAWGFTSSFFWSLIVHLSPQNRLDTASGIIGSAVNIAAAPLPLVVASLSPNFAMLAFISVSIIAVLTSWLAYLSHKKDS